eukprot:scaffold26496_cov113-Cylindrotheca_fusiformis.AAC.7
MAEQQDISHTCGRWRQACYRSARSSFWKATILVATVLLLFGSPIQFMFFSKSADAVFDGLFTFAFAVFIFDMMLNISLKPDYLPICRQLDGGEARVFRRRGIGSFMFWCDLVSSFAMLHDISYVNSRAFETPTIDIKLDEYGVPVSFI